MKKFLKIFSVIVVSTFICVAFVQASFPTALNNFQSGDIIHSADWNNIETYLGILGSAVTSSITYKLTSTSSIDPGHKHTDSSVSGTISMAHGGTGTSTTLGNDAIWIGDASGIFSSTLPSCTAGALQYNTSTNAFACGALSTATSGITSLNGLSTTSQVFATSNDTNVGIDISSSGATHTITGRWLSFLSIIRGGTGTTTAPSVGMIPIAFTAGQYGPGNITGTANQITVATSTTAITLSTPQNIAAASTPTFAGLTLSGVTSGFVKVNSTGVFSTSTPNLSTDITGILAIANGGHGTSSLPSVGMIPIAFTSTQFGFGNILGTANQVSVATTTTSITLSTPQSIGTASSPTFTGLTLSGVTSGFLKNNSTGVVSTSTISLTADVSGVLPLANGGTNTTTAFKVSKGFVIDRPASADPTYDAFFNLKAVTLTNFACVTKNGTSTIALNSHPVNSGTTSTLVASLVAGGPVTASTTSFAAQPGNETWLSWEVLSSSAVAPSSTACTIYFTVN